MIFHLAVSGTERFTIEIAFLTALLTLLGLVGHGMRRLFGAIIALISELHDTTAAVQQLGRRVTHLESAALRPYTIEKADGETRHIYRDGTVAVVKEDENDGQ